MIKKKKLIITVLSCLLALVALINIVWFIWVQSTYNNFINNMQKDEEFSIIVPSYYMTDDEGFDYNVKYPDYLGLTGNLGVSLPWVDYDNPWTDSLIIWPSITGECTFGVVLYEEDEDNNVIEHQIYVDKNGNALDKQYDDIISRHGENINTLLNKAKNQWSNIF